MKLVWVLLIVVVAISGSKAKSVLNKKTIKRNVTKALNPSTYVITRRRNGLSPNMPDRANKFIINLNPTIKHTSVSKTQINPEKYRGRLMKKISIKYINNKNRAKITTEVTTRRTLMQTKKFTVRPHDVHGESIREKYNYNSNRRNSANIVKKSKSEKDIFQKNFESSYEEDNSEKIFLNFRNVDMSINDNDSNEFAKQSNENGFIAAGSQKSKAMLLFPKRYNRQYLKVNTKPAEENKFLSDTKIYFNIESTQNSVDEIMKEKRKLILNPNVFRKSDPKYLKEVLKPKENLADQKTDQDEFIFVKGRNKKDISIVKPTVVANDAIITDSNIDVLVAV